MAASILASSLLCTGVFWVLQHRLERHLGLSYAPRPARRAPYIVRTWLVLVSTVALLWPAAGAGAPVLVCGLLIALFALDLALLARLGRVLSPCDLHLPRELRHMLPHYLDRSRVGAGLLAAAGILAIAGAAGHYGPATADTEIALAIAAAGVIVGLARRAAAWRATGGPLNYLPTDQNLNVHRLGFVLQALVAAAPRMRRRPPAGHEERLRSIEALPAPVARAGPVSSTRPHVIVLMLESYFDLAAAGVPLARDPLQASKSLLRAGAGHGGSIRVSVLGGNTCNTEFEALTGVDLAEAGIDDLPYVGTIDRRTYALPHALKRHGYRVSAVHPFHRWFYNRDAVYEHFGFDEYYATESFDGAARRYGQVSDQAFAGFCGRLATGHVPSFVFGVSIMGHGPYPPSEAGGIYVPDGPGIEPGLRRSVDRYCEILEATDRALVDLRDQLEAAGHPYVLLAFGDHAPAFGDAGQGYQAWQELLGLPHAPEPGGALFRTPSVLLSNMPSVLARGGLTDRAAGIGRHLFDRLALDDPSIFGRTNPDRFDAPGRACQVHDLLFGEQRLTKHLLARPATGYHANRDRYQRHAEASRLVGRMQADARSGRIDRLERQFAALSESDPGFADAALLVGAARIDAGHVNAGVFDLLASSGRARPSFWCHYHRIRASLRVGDARGTLSSDAHAAAQGWPEHIPLLSDLARAAAKDSRPQDAAGIALACFMARPDPSLGLLLAACLLDTGGDAETIRHALEVARRAEDPAWALYHACRWAIRQDDAVALSQAADELAARATGPAPHEAREALQLLGALAREQFQHHRFGLARWMAQACLAAGAQDAALQLLLAVSLIECGGEPRAIRAALAQAGTAADPGWAIYHRCRFALARGERQELDEALHDAVRLAEAPPAIPLQQEPWEALARLAGEQFQERRFDEAASIARASARFRSSDAMLHLVLATSLLEVAGDRGTIRSALAVALTADDPTWARYHLSRLDAATPGPLPAEP